MPFKGISYLELWQPFYSAELKTKKSQALDMLIGNITIAPLKYHQTLLQLKAARFY